MQSPGQATLLKVGREHRLNQFSPEKLKKQEEVVLGLVNLLILELPQS